MSRLNELVLAAAARAKGRNGYLEPQYLEMLEKAAEDDAGGSFSSYVAPVATDTQEVLCDIDTATSKSPTVTLEFPRPVEIVGFYASLISLGGAGIVPTKDDVGVEITLDTRDRLTDAAGLGASNGAGTSFVTLGALHIHAPRLMRLPLTSGNPRIQLAFRYKNATASYYATSRVGLAAFYRYLQAP